jgi:hypothetical protein
MHTAAFWRKLAGPVLSVVITVWPGYVKRVASVSKEQMKVVSLSGRVLFASLGSVTSFLV